MNLPTPWELTQEAAPQDAEDFAAGARIAYLAVVKALRESAMVAEFPEETAYAIADAIRQALEQK